MSRDVELHFFWHFLNSIMCRYESLDDLDALRQSPVQTSTFSYPRPQSAAAGYCAPTRNSTSRYSTGAILPHSRCVIQISTSSLFSMCCFYFISHFWPLNVCCPRTVSGRRTCCVCERVLGGGAAMTVEALSLCFHLACFQVRGRDPVVKVRSQRSFRYSHRCSRSLLLR